MNEELLEKVEKIVAHQFDLVTNLTQEAYIDSLRMIAEQAIPLISAKARKQERERMWNLLESYRSGDSEKGLLYTIPHRDWVAFRQALRGWQGG